MKIGILTQPLHENYGGLLQNYALQQVLIRAGHEVETMNQCSFYQRKARAVLSNIKAYLLHFIRFREFEKLKYQPTIEEVAVIRKKTNYFIEKYINCSDVFKNRNDLKRISKQNNYDAYVVGSDQCWRPLYNRFISAMFLDFAKDKRNIKRISYAASFGSEIWEFSPKLTLQCAESAKMFDLITVREDAGIGLCKRYFGVDAKQVLDPTMLLSKEDYIKLIEQEDEPKTEGTLFNYILDPSEKNAEFINKIATQVSLKPFKVLPKKQAEIRTKDDIKNHIEDCVYPAVTTWLRAFMDTEMVICDSFHGCVFSIIFNKPFWVLGNKKRGNVRFNSLLKVFGLEDRLIDAKDCVDINAPIDWDTVNAIRAQKSAYSIELLLNALK